jgi:hypothetical protein
MKFQIETRAFSRFTFSFLQYSSKYFDAAVQVSRLHVPPYAVWCLVPYVLTWICLTRGGYALHLTHRTHRTL